MSKIDELQQKAAVIKNETEAGANTAKRVGEAFESVADAMRQNIEDGTITLDKLNEFPATLQQAIDFVKNNGKQANFTVVNDSFSVGVVSIFVDAGKQVITEIFETRLTLQNNRFTKGHSYGAPVKYWRNYGVTGSYNQGAVKKGEWTKWGKCEDETAMSLYKHSKFLFEIYDGSPNGEPKTLAEVVAAINSQYTNEFKRCFFTSFVDRTTGKRVVYHCTAAEISANESDWQVVGTGAGDNPEGGAQKPSVMPFVDFVENSIVQLSSTIGGDVVWDTAKKVFLCRAGGKFYSSWGNVANYGEVTVDGVKPRNGVIFFQISTGKCYTWEGGEFTQLSNGWSAEITDYAKRKIDEAVEAAKKIKKGEDGKDGRIALVNHGANDTTFALTPNVMHVWGEVERLNLSLAPNTEPNIRAEYDFQFTTPANKATEFQLQGVQWYDGVVPTILKGKTYQGSVVNGVAILISN